VRQRQSPRCTAATMIHPIVSSAPITRLPPLPFTAPGRCFPGKSGRIPLPGICLRSQYRGAIH
jgi:hypothetical protein